MRYSAGESCICWWHSIRPNEVFVLNMSGYRSSILLSHKPNLFRPVLPGIAVDQGIELGRINDPHPVHTSEGRNSPCRLPIVQRLNGNSRCSRQLWNRTPALLANSENFGVVAGVRAAGPGREAGQGAGLLPREAGRVMGEDQVHQLQRIRVISTQVIDSRLAPGSGEQDESFLVGLGEPFLQKRFPKIGHY